jgi:hypothetical protein
MTRTEEIVLSTVLVIIALALVVLGVAWCVSTSTSRTKPVNLSDFIPGSSGTPEISGAQPDVMPVAEQLFENPSGSTANVSESQVPSQEDSRNQGTYDQGPTGDWSLDLDGTLYSCRGIEVRLEEDGTISAGSNAAGFSRFQGGSYNWEGNGGRLTMTCNCEITAGVIGVVPVEIVMEGRTDSNTASAGGRFSARSLSEALADFNEGGTFKMTRV